MTYSNATVRRALALLGKPMLALADIEARTGVCRKTLYRWARAAGLPPRSRAHGSIFDAKTRRLAVRLYRQGLTMDQIGARTGASKHAIRQWARASGEPLRATHTRSRIDHQQAVALQAQHGTREAARLLQCSESAVRYHVERARRLAVRTGLRRGR